MQKHRDMTLNRLQILLRPDQLPARVYGAPQPVQLQVFNAPGRITWDAAQAGTYRPAAVGESFGPQWSTHWFRVELQIPAAWAGKEVHLLWNSESEACVWEAGVPLQGLTGGMGTVATRADFLLTKSAVGGETRTYYVEMACNHLFGSDARMDKCVLRQAEIAVFDPQAWGLLWDFAVVSEMARHLPAETPRGGQALAAANNMVNALLLDDRSTWATARAIAKEYLSVHNGAGQHQLSAIGHAHIDSAWLWPRAETMRKCYRTFATADRYMAEYPHYQFACSQAVQWEWIKLNQPALYTKLLARAKEGRFVPAGGTWVEPDCNLPSGESLVRQFLLGQRFFQQELGTRCTEFWNPDVFGYSAQLPQIMRGAGIKYFLTQKLSWNQFNKLPSHTFHWEGLDGSRVLTHFPPTDTYNAVVTVQELLFHVKNYKDHERGKESYMLYGYGDGGGGPTREMIERLTRCADVDGLPLVKSRAPREFFQRLEADIKDPLVWVGELYFELHRGTYTTQAHNKLNNRQCEFLLHDVELLAAVGHALGRHAYPGETLTALWKTVLFNQFHDVIPGSSITEVYRDSDKDYAEVASSATALRATAATALAGAPATGATRVAALNTLSCARTELVELPLAITSSQTSAGGQPLGIVSAPALGCAVVIPQTTVEHPVAVHESGASVVLENQYLRVTVLRTGRLASVLDKRVNREVLAGPGNNLVLYEDQPVNWDAWDVDVFHLEKRRDVSAATGFVVSERGPLRAAVQVTYALSARSTLTQTISLDAIAARVDFATAVDWHERHQFLKVEFPLALRALAATHEVQFGHLERPTHFNTSWDMARFEVCAHKWCDLTESDYGVALLNDSKYGHAVHGNVMRLSLLRAPTSPDPEADQGQHAFRYALLPHLGRLQTAGVVAAGYRFNSPLLLQPSAAAPGSTAWFKVDSDAVVLDTVKKAEDSGALVARLYEAHGSTVHVRLSSPLPIKGAVLCNLLEDDGEPLAWQDGGVTLTLSPFKIVSVKLLL